MTSYEDPKKPVADLVEVAQSVIDGKEPIVDGLRKMTSLIHATPHADDEILRWIRGYESETDGYPRGKVRENYAPEFLARLDADMEKYLGKVRDDIINICKEIVHKYKQDKLPVKNVITYLEVKCPKVQISHL